VLPNYSATGEGIDSLAIIKKIVQSVREPSSDGSVSVAATTKPKSPVANLKAQGAGQAPA
jgi:hypothetical protein